MREVITLQVGNCANFVGAHFWNFQDELMGVDPNTPEGAHAADIDFDVLFREGETSQGIATYTPRLLVFDIKGSLGAVRAVGSLYDPPPAVDLSAVATWRGGKALYQSQAVEKNEYLRSLEEEGWEPEASVRQGGGSGVASTSGRLADSSAAGNGDYQGQGAIGADRRRAEALETSVNFWTDYLKAHLHPRSVVEVKTAWVERVTGGGFRPYGEGRALLADVGSVRDEAADRLRFFAEESDHLQGFQCLVDDSGGFSALGSEILSEIADEYPRVARILVPIQQPTAHLDPSQRLSSLVQELTYSVSFATLSSLADLVVPLGRPSLGLFPHLIVDDQKQYHTSAVYAAALDSMLLPYRLKSSGAVSAANAPIGACDMASFVRLLARTPALRVASCAMSLPAGPVPAQQHMETSTLTAGMASLTPLVEVGMGEGPSAEALSLRGALLKGSQAAAPLSTAHTALQKVLSQEARRLCIFHLTLSQQPLAVPLPFPFLFAPAVGRHGQVQSCTPAGGTFPGKGGLDVVSTPVLTRLSSDGPAVPLLKHRLEALKSGMRRGSAGGTLLTQWGFLREDQEELSESLQELLEGSVGGPDEGLDDWEE